MTAGTRPTTAKELLGMSDDGFRYELVRGELRRMPYRGMREGSVAGAMVVGLGGYVNCNRLGVATTAGGYRLASDPDSVLAPPVGIVLRDRAEAVGRTDDYFPGAPDVAVEVTPPGDNSAYMEENTRDYLAAGTLAVIVVDPWRRTVTVHRPGAEPDALTEADVLAVEDVVPGWRMRVGEIFE